MRKALNILPPLVLLLHLSVYLVLYRGLMDNFIATPQPRPKSLKRSNNKFIKKRPSSSTRLDKNVDSAILISVMSNLRKADFFKIGLV